jgi:glutamyl-tRNA(Gln) amidotransferase subunit E
MVSDAREVVLHSSFQPAREAMERGDFACAVRLPGCRGLLNHRTQPGISFYKELEDRVRVIACPAEPGFMAHSESADGGLCELEWAELARSVGAEEGDALVAAWMPREDAATAAREILIRVREALQGVPSETRQAFADGTTGFERILPGPDRMYPDTDTPPLPIPDSTVTEVGAQRAETPWDRQARYECLGIERRMARALAMSVWKDLFDEIAPARGEPARRLAGTLEKRLPFHLRRRRGARARYPRELPDAARLAPLVRALEQNEIRPEALVSAVDDTLKRPDRSVEEILAEYRPRSGDDELLERLAHEVAAAGRTMEGRSREVLMRWGIGPLMNELKGRIAPDRVRKALDDALGPDEAAHATELSGRERAR